MRYKSGEGLTGWVFEHNEIVNVPDLTADDRWSREPEFEGYLPSGLAKTALIVPLRAGERTLGALGVVNKKHASAFTQRDENYLLSLAGQVAVAIEKAQLYENIRELSVSTIRSLTAAIDARDPYTHGHSQGVTYLAVELGKQIGLIPAELELLEFAALLHDVGKISVPDQILRKKEKLTPSEWESIRLHPYHGIQIIHPVAALAKIEPWIYHHHEKWDGSGYPDGLRGEDIPLEARIIAIADSYNAMTTDRPYRRALSQKEALAEIRHGTGTQFDPNLAEAFIILIVGRNDSPGVSKVLS
ncbi:MAG: HD domain-containing protein [Anaerolineales bacterium]|nr:HD domain-containing protein [Anaerolineales bacterium]